MKPNRSGEIDALTEYLKMIGGAKEYQIAMIVAAFIKIHRDDIDVEIFKYQNAFTVLVSKKNAEYVLMRATLANKYMEWFKEDILDGREV